MSLYNQAGFTVDPYFPIPVDAAPAVGMDETGRAAELQEFSEGYAPHENITADVALTGTYATVTLTFATAPDFETLSILWQWGDGASETSEGPGDTTQGHDYVVPGSYIATATIQRPGVPSVDMYVPVLVE